MIVVCSDTHSATGHECTDHLLERLGEATLVVHAGDFKTEAALDAFERESQRLVAVHGNVDEPAVRERLPAERTVEEDGIRIAVTHRRNGGQTGLAMFGRERDADVVVSGHTHRPALEQTGELVLVNPGSHAQPRGNRPGYAEIEPLEAGFRVRLLEPDGLVVETLDVER